jgi:hypothetical protein
MRFIFQDKLALLLTVKILYSKAKLGTSTSDSSRVQQIKKCVHALCSKFLKVDPSLEKLPNESKKLSSLSDEDVELVAGDSHSYYVAKLCDNFKFCQDEDAATDQERSTPMKQSQSPEKAAAADDSEMRESPSKVSDKRVDT